MSPSQPPDHDEIVRQVQRLAGRAFLSCSQLEEHLKRLLKFMATLKVGNLKPADTEGILNGDRKLTSGQVFKEILANTQGNELWPELVEQALAARNKLIHGILFSRWAAVSNAEDLENLKAELKPLVNQVHDGVEAIQFLFKGYGEWFLHHHPERRTPEWQRFIEADPTLKITILSQPPTDKAGK
jgi:hypothetical protein